MGDINPVAPAVADVKRFLKDTPLVAEELGRWFTDVLGGFKADQILRRRVDTETGAIDVEVVGSSKDGVKTGSMRVVPPGAEYPVVGFGEGRFESISVPKMGGKHPFTDERISQDRRNIVQESLQAMALDLVRRYDTAAFALVAAKVAQTFAAQPWDALAKFLTDLELAAAKLESWHFGYSADMLVVTRMQAAKLRGLGLAYAAGSGTIPGAASYLPYPLLTSDSLPDGWEPMLLDSTRLGGYAHFAIDSAGGYSPVPGTTVEVATWRDPETDGMWVQTRKADTPFVSNPLAGVKLTGAGL